MKKQVGGRTLPNSVSLVKLENNGDNLKGGISKALNLIDFKPPSSVSSIVIKVNLCYYWNASTGQTTDPLLVSAFIDYLRDAYGRDVEIKVAEADASAMQTKYAFPLLGYTKLAKQKNVQLLNLSEDAIEEHEIQVNGRKIALKVPKTLLESSLFINIPKLKVMRATHITCAMKNLFGAIALPKKVTYHPLLAEAIVAINKVLKPHLNIVDGIVGLGNYPVKLNLVMAGADAFAIDYVAAKVMGYNPSKIRFLNLAIQEHEGNPKDIQIIGEKIETFRKDFPTENTLAARMKMRLQFSVLRAYSRISGDIIPPSIDDV
jgi:uncharacterized protein (DUF362 family)